MLSRFKGGLSRWKQPLYIVFTELNSSLANFVHFKHMMKNQKKKKSHSAKILLTYCDGRLYHRPFHDSVSRAFMLIFVVLSPEHLRLIFIFHQNIYKVHFRDWVSKDIYNHKQAVSTMDVRCNMHILRVYTHADMHISTCHIQDRKLSSSYVLHYPRFQHALVVVCYLNCCHMTPSCYAAGPVFITRHLPVSKACVDHMTSVCYTI